MLRRGKASQKRQGAVLDTANCQRSHSRSGRKKLNARLLIRKYKRVKIIREGKLIYDSAKQLLRAEKN